MKSALSNQKTNMKPTEGHLPLGAEGTQAVCPLTVAAVGLGQEFLWGQA